MRLTDSLSRTLNSLLFLVARDILPLLLFAAASALAMYPVLSDPMVTIVGWHGDNVQYAYMTGWVARALTQLRSPFTDPAINPPDGLSLAATDTPFLSMVLASPIAILWNDVLAYNAIIFVSHLLSGYITYRWILSLTGSRFAGLISGFVFLLSPFRIVKSYGHLQLVSTQFIPLFFWALDRAVRRLSNQRVALLAGATFLVGSMSQYYLVFCLLTGGVYALFASPLKEHATRRMLAGLLAVALGAASSAAPYLLVWLESGFVSYDVLNNRVWSAGVLDFFIPSRLHPLWGAQIESLAIPPIWVAHTLYLGAAALGLAAVAAARHDDRRLVMTWILTGFTGLLLALGTDLHINGHELSHENPIWLPAYYLSQLPFTGFIRVWSRAGIIPILFVSLLAGLGASYLKKTVRWSGSFSVACVVLILIDFAPGRLQYVGLGDRPVDRWLASQSGEFSVVFLPLAPAVYDAVNYLNLYGSLTHRKALSAYNHPNHVPPSVQRVIEAAEGFPSDQAISAIRGLGYRYVALHRFYLSELNGEEWSSIENRLLMSPSLDIVAQTDQYTVVELR